LVCGLCQHAQNSQADQEPVRHRTLAQSEGDPKRVTLRRREHVKFIEQGCAHLVQRRERELHLRLDSCDAHDAAVRSSLGQVPQQRRLAYPRLAADHQCAALTPAQSLQKAIQFAALRGAAD